MDVAEHKDGEKAVISEEKVLFLGEIIEIISLFVDENARVLIFE